MDERIIKIVASKLKSFKGQPMTKEKLAAIRDEIYRQTKTNRFAPLSNIKKWVKAARSMLKKKGKEAKAKPTKKVSKPKTAPPKAHEPEIPTVPKKVEESVAAIKTEMAPAVEVPLPTKPTIVFDRVYLQSIKFEIASMRQMMERISRQLDKLEKTLSEHAEEE